MLRLATITVAGVAVAALLAPPLHAEDEPYLALRTGLKCAQCHINHTGGGGRTDFGSAWAQTQLPARTLPFQRRALNDWIAIGLDLRARASGAISDTDPRTTVDMPEAQVQVEARLVRNVLAIYLDQTVGPDRSFAREAFALVERLPGNGYAKAGKLLLPYGLRLWDDQAFIRSLTGFTYTNPDVGFEVGFEPGPLALAVALSNGGGGGVDANSGKQVTGSAALVFPRFRLGVSGSHNTTPGNDRGMVAGFAGVQVGPIGLLGEADLILDSFDTQPDRDQFVGYVEGNWLVRRGFNLKVTYGYHDPTAGLRDGAPELVEDQRIRMRFGVELFPVTFVQVSSFYTLLDDIPQVTTDVDQVSLEVHLHF
jgi:hypothetical protein